MLKVLKANKNKLTHGYTPSHKGYNHSGRGDQNYYSSFSGVIVQSKNTETETWRNKGKLTTRDYGNYIKIKAQVNGKVVYQLGAHFKPGTVLQKGTRVSAGQVIAQIGKTGNVTGKTSHTEYMDKDNERFPVVFVDKLEKEDKNIVETTKKQQIIDAYLGARPSLPPSEDEINARLQENKNSVEITRDILTGDGNAREYWLDRWEIDQSNVNWEETAKAYQDNFNRIKEIYGLTPSSDTEELLGASLRAQERIKELEQLTEPKTVYKVDGKNFSSIIKIGKYRIILEK